MTIYNFSDAQLRNNLSEQLRLFPAEEMTRAQSASGSAGMVRNSTQEKSPRDRLLSSCMARLFFVVLLSVDLSWAIYSVLRLAVLASAHALTAGRSARLRTALDRCILALRRSVVCALALVVALFCPSFGILVACAYFLMYDKEGIDEVVPASLKEQFQDLFEFAQNSAP